MTTTDILDISQISPSKGVDLPICHKCGATLLLFDEHKCKELKYPAYHLREATKKIEESKLETLSSSVGHKDIIPETNEAQTTRNRVDKDYLKEFDEIAHRFHDEIGILSGRDQKIVMFYEKEFSSSIERARREGYDKCLTHLTENARKAHLESELIDIIFPKEAR